GLDLGAFTPFLWCFRDREKILRIFEKICGQRLNYNYIRVGGVAFDVTDNMIDDIDWFVNDYFEPKWQDVQDLFTKNRIFIERTANVGPLSAETAIQYGCTGPVLRGSGVKRDIRKDRPYAGYENFEFDVPVGEGLMGTVGDCWDRYYVRVLEVMESLKIIKQALPRLRAAEGPNLHKKVARSVKVPKGECYMAVENPRGELGYYIVSEGKLKPYRVKARAPSFHNISVLPELSVGVMVADICAIIGSLDIVMGEVDR
ncbi:MAG: NADH-quinone oxidoreductase subunit D, partial [Planctomycetota bacterium]